MVETTNFGNLASYTYLLLTLNLTLALIVMFFNCLCCKKRIPKNDFLGLEGMVKLKNPDDIIVVSNNNANNASAGNANTSLVHNSESQAELNASTVSNADSEKRSSTAAHRSLPDIPVAESNDNGSELYETVADKQLANAHNQSPQPSLKKQASVSQHSSISQADDVSSPYSRVKGLPHDYAKVRATEHPYAQLNAPSTSNALAAAAASGGSAAAVAAATTKNASSGSKVACSDSLHRGSQLSSGSSQHLNDESSSQVEIPAASAIAGMISASQDLPYMTPPIANQHFSGDSQDSSKGYTSISVREPLANILAQQPANKLTARSVTLTRDVNDSHYATVSDDSDETYAAIEDPNNRHILHATDIYTSGSETYAQIQPMPANPIVVAVEINNSSSISAEPSTAGSSSAAQRASSSSMEHAMPVPPNVDSLRAQMHSRQASSSSSVCNLGSPKPEKRQANSPLPPTPKASLGSSNLTSGRSSVISVIEAAGNEGGNNDANNEASNEASPQRKHSKSLSPSKDVDGGSNRNIEGMYAKVMKKHKFSSHQPELLGISPLDSAAAALLMDTQKSSTAAAASAAAAGDKSRVRSNSYTAKDHGYETIPADGGGAQKHSQMQLSHENRKSDCYAASMLQKERLQESAASDQRTPHNNSSQVTTITMPSNSIKHYETINCPPCQEETNRSKNSHSHSNNDPGYEQLQQTATIHSNDDDAKKSDYDPNYEVLKSRAHSDDGYAKVLEKKPSSGADVVDASGGYSTIPGADANHNYASILETKQANNETDHYARIAENTLPDPQLAAINSPNSTASLINSLSMITVTTSTSMLSSLSSQQQTPHSSQYESLSETDPNYESVCYLNTTTTTATTTEATTNSSSNNDSNTTSSISSSNSNNTDPGYERLEQSVTSSPLSNDQQLVVDDYFQV
ncbi:mucin-19 [Drosophila grimshawi]|uniref:GH14082 n=1 Tax=Drosophila grimshawi TaxID=7222 RepID=B4JY55_DROGR|nr:mucin-19 [Drosophila grimshawi]EDV90617.1 GH14082 [Drosophila grimshawi]